LRNIGLLLMLLFVAVACGRGDSQPRFSLDPASVAPDEFSVLPAAPLSMPASTALAPPEPGAPNRVEIDYRVELIKALGGRAGPMSQAEALRVAEITAKGADGDPRSTGNIPIDPWVEAEKLRAMGISVPPAPPRTP